MQKLILVKYGLNSIEAVFVILYIQIRSILASMNFEKSDVHVVYIFGYKRWNYTKHVQREHFYFYKKHLFWVPPD